MFAQTKALQAILPAVLASILFCYSHTAWSSQLQARQTIGLNIFTAFLAADLDITRKQDTDKQLHVLIISRNEHAGMQAQKHLQARPPVKQLKIKATVVHPSQLTGYADQKIAGIFILDANETNIKPIKNFAVANEALDFSPWRLHMVQGVSAGIQVSDRILPMINNETLKQSNIRLKKFFLKVAVPYGQ